LSRPERNISIDARRLLTTRGLRGFADGAVSVLLASHLSAIGFSPTEIGAIVTATLLGSAALTLAVGMFADRVRRRDVLIGASILMLSTGIGFFGARAFLAVIVIAFVGTLNPSSGDVSVFLPVEQAILGEVVPAADRISVFARYNLSGSMAGALGALASGLPSAAALRLGYDPESAMRWGFVAYSVVAVVVGLVYRALTPAIEPRGARPKTPLAKSRRVVLHLAALFSLDSLGGGFVVQSLLALWLFRRFDLSVATAGTVFFVAGILSAFSQLLSARLAARIGLIPTMVFTHLPANALLVLAAFMPNAPLAITLLLLRMSMASMDVPARQAYVLSVVPAEERAAAASVTNVPRSLASAATPFLAGAMLAHSSFGWPLVCGGATKILYDLLLLAQFRARKPDLESA
jgi:predicted MFS family arabinose efflux permease